MESPPSTAYVGEDRRRAQVSGALPLAGIGVTSAALGIGIAAGVLITETEIGRADDRAVIAIVLATAAAAVAVAGAMLCFARFRMVSERPTLTCGITLLLVGLGWLLPARVGPMLRSEWRTEVGGFALGSALMIGALALSLALLPKVDSNLTIRSHVIWAAVGVGLFGAIVATGAPEQVGVEAFEGPAPGQVIAGPTLGLAAALLLLLAYRRQRTILAYVGLCLLGLEAAELLATQANTTGDPAWVASCLIGLFAVAAAMRGVIEEYREGYDVIQTHLFESRIEKELANRKVEWQSAVQEERFHDLRSGLLGVEAVALSGALRSASAKGLLAQELARLRQLTQASPGAPVHFDLMELLGTIAELRLRQGDAVAIEGPPSLPIHASPNDFAEIMFNLLDNAARHAPRTPVLIRVTDRGPDVELKIRDRGPGISEDMLPRLFERGATTHAEGSGLGLYISTQLTNRLGGQISAQNRIGGGAEFTIEVPRRQPTEGVPDPRPAIEVEITEAEEPSLLEEPDGASSGWTRRRTQI